MINEQLIQVAIKNDTFEISSPLYYILLIEAKSVFTIDLVSYHAVPNRVVFLSPYQHFQLTDTLETSIQSLSFHADFYCIEYHKKEVRSEEHTSELQSRENLVCRLLLE